MKTLQKSLRKRLSREEFIEKFYNKSKSSGSKSVLTSVLKLFDKFCLDVYGNDSENLLEELRGDMGDALYNFLQDFIKDSASPILIPELNKVRYNALRSGLE